MTAPDRSEKDADGDWRQGEPHLLHRRTDRHQERLDPYSRPRLRGWLHAYAFYVATACAIVLCSLAAAHEGRRALLGCAVYAVTACGLFGVSGLYHVRVWTP